MPWGERGDKLVHGSELVLLGPGIGFRILSLFLSPSLSIGFLFLSISFSHSHYFSVCLFLYPSQVVDLSPEEVPGARGVCLARQLLLYAP